MATHAPITGAQTRAPFIDQLLAPLPAGEEQVYSPGYVRQVMQDWRRGMDDVRYAEAGHLHEALGLRLKIPGHSERVSLMMFRNLIEKRLLPSVLERPQVQAAIARDEARLIPAGRA